jgi:hypothetical protein
VARPIPSSVIAALDAAIHAMVGATSTTRLLSQDNQHRIR